MQNRGKYVAASLDVLAVMSLSLCPVLSTITVWKLLEKPHRQICSLAWHTCMKLHVYTRVFCSFLYHIRSGSMTVSKQMDLHKLCCLLCLCVFIMNLQTFEMFHQKLYIFF